MTTTVEDRDMGMDAIIQEIESEGGFVDIGVQSDESEMLLIIAAANEFGTKNIPQRPFIRSAIDENEELFLTEATRLSKDITGGTITKFEALSQMGLLIEGEIKKNIINLRTPPNAPSTVKRKGSDNPLIDKGVLVGSIRYAVQPGEA